MIVGKTSHLLMEVECGDSGGISEKVETPHVAYEEARPRPRKRPHGTEIIGLLILLTSCSTNFLSIKKLTPRQSLVQESDFFNVYRQTT